MSEAPTTAARDIDTASRRDNRPLPPNTKKLPCPTPRLDRECLDHAETDRRLGVMASTSLTASYVTPDPSFNWSVGTACLRRAWLIMS